MSPRSGAAASDRPVGEAGYVHHCWGGINLDYACAAAEALDLIAEEGDTAAGRLPVSETGGKIATFMELIMEETRRYFRAVMVSIVLRALGCLY
jgi:hypothetical protein